MALLAICILFNAYIGIVFKYFKKFDVRNLQAIVLNYFVCAITASFVMGHPAVTPEIVTKEWLWAALVLGFLFIFTFNLFAVAVQQFGVVISSVFQKMSLLAPTIIAILYFGESANLTKILGILIAIAAIITISFSKSAKELEKEDHHSSAWMWIFPIGTFLGSCMIDTGLFYVNKTGLANSLDIDFIASLFFFSGCFGLLLVIKEYINNGIGYRKKDIIAGIALGVPNFFSIYFLLKVLSNGMDGSVVFPINNVGILLTTALLGIILFRERFSLQKIIGFCMAIIAILLIASENFF